MNHRAGILHTVPALAGPFQTTIQAAMPGIELVHIADPWLLQTAIDVGVTDEVADRLAAHVRSLVHGGAEAVLVTCSSVGEAVEVAAEAESVPVLRVDAPMADDAVRIAADAGRSAGRPGRIAVLATLDATLGPTGRLIRRRVEAASADIALDAHVVPGAVAARDRGEQDEHDRRVREAVEGAAREADVIILAQASMAAAAPALRDTIVLTSPAGGVAALVRALTGDS